MSSPEELFAELFSDLPRLAPGSDADTARALAAVGPLPRGAQVADIGCGSGRSTLLLAERVAGSVVGVDMHEPYLEALVEEAERRGVAQRLTTHLADMSELPFAPASLDLIWAEGSIYIMGFEQGLAAWRQFLKPGGWLAATELTWLTEERPRDAVDFWAEGYPAMTTIEDNLEALAKNGYRPHEVFPLATGAWEEEYYGPLSVRLRDFKAKHRGSEAAHHVAAAVEHEIDVFRSSAGAYSYVFYVAQRLDD